jgi:hypothetical protein
MWGKRDLCPETPASLWQNELGLAVFHHELNQSANKSCGVAMPTETAIVVAAIVAAFAIYAATLIWADLYTRNYQPPH